MTAVAVVTPYNRGEITAAALRVADVARLTGCDVRVLGLPRCELPTHDYWDQRVRSARLAYQTAQALRGADWCLWFTPVAPTWLSYAKQLAPEARHALVAAWHSLRAEDALARLPYDKIVCPSAAALAAVRAQWPGLEEKTTGILFSGGLSPLPPRRALVTAGRVRVLLWCDASAIDESGVAVLALVDRLLGRYKHVNIELACRKAWNRRDRRRLRELAGLWPSPRLTVSEPRSLFEQTRLFLQHDLLVLPAVRYDFALAAAQAACCRLPLVGYHLPPLNEQASYGWCELVACERSGNWLGALTAAPNTAGLGERVGELVGDRGGKLLALQQRDWRLEAAEEIFRSFWLELWGLA